MFLFLFSTVARRGAPAAAAAALGLACEHLVSLAEAGARLVSAFERHLCVARSLAKRDIRVQPAHVGDSRGEVKPHGWAAVPVGEVRTRLAHAALADDVQAALPAEDGREVVDKLVLERRVAPGAAGGGHLICFFGK